MKKTIYITTFDLMKERGEVFDLVVTFDLQEAISKAKAEYKKTPGLVKGRNLYISAYSIECSENTSAAEAWNEHLDALENAWLEDPADIIFLDWEAEREERAL